MSSRINTNDLSQRAKEILNQVKESRERYVVEEDGKPIAAVISIDDLARLEESAPAPKPSLAQALEALKRAEAVREMILKERNGKPLPDSVKTIRRIRAQRDRRNIKKRVRGKSNLR